MNDLDEPAVNEIGSGRQNQEHEVFMDDDGFCVVVSRGYLKSEGNPDGSSKDCSEKKTEETDAEHSLILDLRPEEVNNSGNGCGDALKRDDVENAEKDEVMFNEGSSGKCEEFSGEDSKFVSASHGDGVVNALVQSSETKTEVEFHVEISEEGEIMVNEERSNKGEPVVSSPKSLSVQPHLVIEEISVVANEGLNSVIEKENSLHSNIDQSSSIDMVNSGMDGSAVGLNAETSDQQAEEVEEKRNAVKREEPLHSGFGVAEHDASDWNLRHPGESHMIINMVASQSPENCSISGGDLEPISKLSEPFAGGGVAGVEENVSANLIVEGYSGLSSGGIDGEVAATENCGFGAYAESLDDGESQDLKPLPLDKTSMTDVAVCIEPESPSHQALFLHSHEVTKAKSTVRKSIVEIQLTSDNLASSKDFDISNNQKTSGNAGEHGVSCQSLEDPTNICLGTIVDDVGDVNVTGSSIIQSNVTDNNVSGSSDNVCGEGKIVPSESRASGAFLEKISTEDPESKVSIMIERSKFEVDECTDLKSSNDQNHSVTEMDVKVVNSEVENQTSVDSDDVMASREDCKEVKDGICESASEHAVCPNTESLIADVHVEDEETGGIDIDEVLNWQDEHANNDLDVNLSCLGKDLGLRVNGSFETDITQGLQETPTSMPVDEQSGNEVITHESGLSSDPQNVRQTQDPSTSECMRNADASISGTSSSSLDEHDTLLEQAEGLPNEEQTMDTPIDGEKSNDEACLMASSEKDEAVGKVDDPSLDEDHNLKVNLVSDAAASHPRDATESVSFDSGTPNYPVHQFTETREEVCTHDGIHTMCSDAVEAKDPKFIESEKVSLDPDGCPDEIGKLDSHSLAKSERSCLPSNSNSIEGVSQAEKGSVHLQASECIHGRGADAIADSTVEKEVLYEELCADGEQVDFHEHINEAELSIGSDELISESYKPGTDKPSYQTCHFLPPVNDGEFSVSDLVWGKVRNHPWWPGQICDPADASEKAIKYRRKDCFLVAYFGDQTFAWNDASALRPFRTHFSQIEKHSNSEVLRNAVNCALKEVFRRVELGLACSCIPHDVYSEIETQLLENTGINQEFSKKHIIDKSADASSFEPGKLVEYVRALAQSPFGGADRLELAISKAQLLSYNRYKGIPQLPEFQFCGELAENAVDSGKYSEEVEQLVPDREEDEQIIDKSELNAKEGSSYICEDTSVDSVYSGKKEKSLSELMTDAPYSTNVEGATEVEDEGKSVLSNKRKALETGSNDSVKRLNLGSAKVSTTAAPKPSFKIGECISRVASQLTGSPSILKAMNEKFLKIDDDGEDPTLFGTYLETPEDLQKEKTVGPSGSSSLDEMLSQLHLAAQDPMKGYSFLNPIKTFFSSFRSSVVSIKSQRKNLSSGRTVNARKRKVSDKVGNAPEDFEFDDVNDSYWTDRIVQNYSEEQLHDNENGRKEYQLQAIVPDKPVKSRRSRKKQFSTTVGNNSMDGEESEIALRRKQNLPTEVKLNFAAGLSLPSEVKLNKMFRRFGPLMESETEVDRHAMCARVVFKKCSDAEIAVSSAGKINIFGSMVVTYELNYTPVVSYKPLPLPMLEAQYGTT